jgi:phage tail protein X
MTTWTMTTRQGDTWDMLALRIYGSDKLGYLLLQANPEYMWVIYLPAGLTLSVPQLPVSAKIKSSPLPPWAR